MDEDDAAASGGAPGQGRHETFSRAHEVVPCGEAVETEDPALHERFRLIMYPSGTVVIAF
jgi:hypothetical protein